MTPRQALAAALTILGRDHILVAAGFTPAQAREGSRIAALQMPAPHVTVWHLVGVVALVAGVVVALWLSLWIGGAEVTTFRDSNGNAVAVPCADNPEAWFPARQRGRNGDEADRIYAEQVDALKAICARCPAKEPCLKEALRWDDDGFRAGLTAEERRALDDRSLTLAELAGIA